MSDFRSRFVSRRRLIASGAVLMAGAVPRRASAQERSTAASSFPAQDPEMVREMVTVSHGNLARVKALVARHPALAKVSYDWGFGDWETPIDAASHMGNRDIAEFVLANGARPTIFSAAMLGQLDVVKAFIAAAPGIQRTKGPHSITLLRHAMAGGVQARPVIEYLMTIDGADEPLPTRPLSAGDIATIVGVYAFGPGGRIEITSNTDRVTLASGGRQRGLVHLGSLEFYPAGAEAVRIRFAESTGTMLLTVHDPDVVVTARKGA